MNLQTVLTEAVQRIVASCQPEKIILFGSQVAGRAMAASDIDLLVVAPVQGSKRQQTVVLYRLLRDLGVAKDIVIVRPEEFERARNLVGTIVYPATHGGRVLYDRAA